MKLCNFSMESTGSKEIDSDLRKTYGEFPKMSVRNILKQSNRGVLTPEETHQQLSQVGVPESIIQKLEQAKTADEYEQAILEAENHVR